MTEYEMIIRVKAGNISACKQMFLQYYDIICRFLGKMTKDPDLAEDIAQTVFMKVWMNRESLNERRSLKSYLYVLAKNAAIDYLRTNHFVEFEDELILQDHDTPDLLIEYKETKDLIDARIQTMPPQRQKIFRMSRFENKTNKEIAELLGLSIRTVEKHLELAFRQLRKDDYV